MTIEFETTVDDIVAFNIYHFEHSPAGRRQAFLVRYVVPLIIALLFLLMSGLDDSGLWFAFPGLIVLAAWVILFPILHRWVLRMSVKSFLREGRSPAMIGKRTLMLEDDSIFESTDAGENRTKWKAVEQIVKDHDVIYIYISAVLAHVVPRRAFATEAEFDRFYETTNKLKAQSAG